MVAAVVAPLGIKDWLADAIVAGGGRVVGESEADTLVWAAGADSAGLRRILDANPGISWIQLPWAGVEAYLELMRSYPAREWTSAKGVYGKVVAEHALALTLGVLRGVASFARTSSWTEPFEGTLLGRAVTIVGAGGIGLGLVELLQPFDTAITVVRYSPESIPGTHRVVAPSALDDVLPGTDVLVLALPLVEGSRHLIGRVQLAALPIHAVLVNVARGAHVDQEALVGALRSGSIAGAALDVTDPEPLPPEHPLWTVPTCLVSPHSACPPGPTRELLFAHVASNVRRRLAGEPLAGRVDPALGY